MGSYAHIVLLTDPTQRQRAMGTWRTVCGTATTWSLSEGRQKRLRPGSLLDVVHFAETPPEWLVDQLNHIRRVETVAEGSALP